MQNQASKHPVSDASRRHARLAMRAARRVAQSRHKERTGHQVCQHLLQMLDAEAKPVRAPARKGQAQLGLFLETAVDCGSGPAG